MTSTTTRRPGARRVGYVVAALINAALLYLVHVRPGWRSVPFLTADTPQVLDLLDAALVAGIVVNVFYVVRDPSWLRSLGDLVTTGLGIAVLLRTWRVFPFDFTGYAVDWSLLVRVLLGVGIAGAAVGFVAAFASLTRRLAGGSPGAARRRTRP